MVTATNASSTAEQETYVSVSSFPGSPRGSPGQQESEIVDAQRPFHARQYNVRQMPMTALQSSIMQWLVTCTLAASIGGILLHYNRLGSISSFQNRILNALIIGFSIALAINLESSLRLYASLVRRRLAASFNQLLRDLDPLLGCNGHIEVIKLLFTTTQRSQFIILFLCILSIFTHLAIYILVAVTGFTYSVNPSQAHTVLVPGAVSIANLSAVGDNASQRNRIHNYGIQSTSYNTIHSRTPRFSSMTEALGSSPNLFLHADEVNTYMLYRFRDVNALDHSVSVPSKRDVLTYTICSVPGVTNITDAYEDGKVVPGSLITYAPNWINGATTIYVHEWNNNGTTYISDSNPYCGQGCSHVYILTYANGRYPTIYDCNSTVSRVEYSELGINHQEYEMPDEQARWYAGAIGWTGASGVPSPLPDYSNLESASYINSEWALAPYTPANGPDSAAVLIERFAIGAIAAADQFGPRVVVDNGNAMQPQRAQVLSVDWKATIALLVVITVLQLVALLVVVKWASFPKEADGARN